MSQRKAGGIEGYGKQDGFGLHRVPTSFSEGPEKLQRLEEYREITTLEVALR